MSRVVLALAVALAVVGGCGGGDAGQPSKDEFAARANRICREGEAQIAARTKRLQARLEQADSAAERQKVVADTLERAASEYKPVLDRLGDLEPPESLSGDWARFIDRIGEAFDLIPQLAEAYRDSDRAKLSELTDRFTEIASDTRPFAKENGLDDCLPDSA
jgi:hypothetical protein